VSRTAPDAEETVAKKKSRWDVRPEAENTVVGRTAPDAEETVVKKKSRWDVRPEAENTVGRTAPDAEETVANKKSRRAETAVSRKANTASSYQITASPGKQSFVLSEAGAEATAGGASNGASYDPATSYQIASLKKQLSSARDAETASRNAAATLQSRLDKAIESFSSQIASLQSDLDAARRGRAEMETTTNPDASS